MRKISHKILVLASVTLITTTLWFVGLEVVYARLLSFSTNTVLTVSGRDSNIRVEREDGAHLFRVYTQIDNRQAHYPQKFETLLLPMVMIIAWQLFTWFFRTIKQALRSTALTFGVFLAAHVFFLLLLTAYYSSALAKYTYDAMMDSFYIIALVLIIIDYIRYPVFHLRQSRQI